LNTLSQDGARNSMVLTVSWETDSCSTG